MIQAIQTHYHNCFFRSRLEARWAVYFDAIGIEWQYEPEGYRLSNGEYYLPDFWLPQVEMFAEVKPKEFTKEEKLRSSLLPHWCLILDGLPTARPYLTAGDEDDFKLDAEYLKDEGRFFRCCGGDECDTLEIHDAIEKALSARFEFGESG